jgi:hypothetical protein
VLVRHEANPHDPQWESYCEGRLQPKMRATLLGRELHAQKTRMRSSKGAGEPQGSPATRAELSKGTTMAKPLIDAWILQAGRALPAVILLLSLGLVRGQEQDKFEGEQWFKQLDTWQFAALEETVQKVYAKISPSVVRVLTPRCRESSEENPTSSPPRGRPIPPCKCAPEEEPRAFFGSCVTAEFVNGGFREQGAGLRR